MGYAMPPGSLRADIEKLYPFSTTTLDLIRSGDRTATTRRPFAKPGEVIVFESDTTPYVVTEVRKPDLQSPEGRRAWEEAEGWSLDFIDANPKLKAQVYSPNAVQTFFRPARTAAPDTSSAEAFDRQMGDKQLALDFSAPPPAAAIADGIETAAANPRTAATAEAVLQAIEDAPASVEAAPTDKPMAGRRKLAILAALAGLGAAGGGLYLATRPSEEDLHTLPASYS